MNKVMPERLVRGVYLAGLSISLVTLMLGLGKLLWHGAAVPDSMTLRQCAAAIAQLQAMGLLFLGLAVLALTPLLGMLAALVAFLVQRDRLYVAITVILLLIILAGYLLHLPV